VASLTCRRAGTRSLTPASGNRNSGKAGADTPIHGRMRKYSGERSRDPKLAADVLLIPVRRLTRAPGATICQPARIRHGMIVSSTRVTNANSQPRTALGQLKRNGPNPKRCFHATSPALPCSMAP
jgi:hypothetical protein